MRLKHLIAAMLTPVSFFFLPVPFAAASTPSDSVAVQLPHLPGDLAGQEPFQSFHPRIESDGLVIGNTKYFMMMYKPDSSVDYKILRVIPNMKGLERMRGTFSFPTDIHRRGR
ncbi:MAG TPA: hypothetical protein PL001_11225 [Candidatus Kryptobacter bacterium]|nr:hypothetical protein [Candidatus Kryptobacter bacterium]